MSHFYATIQGNRSEATRMGSALSGMHSNTAGWKGCISVWVFEEDGQDRYIVSLVPWHGSGGLSRVIAEGPLDASAPDFITRGAALGRRDLDMLAAMEIAAADCDAAASKITDGDIPDVSLAGVADGLADCAMMIRTAMSKAAGD